MGVLDDLRQQSNLKKVHEDVQKTREQIWQQNYQDFVLPKMQQIYYYLKEVIDHLKFVDHKIDIDDYCPRYPKFDTLIQQNYRISTDGRGGIGNLDQLKEITIYFDLVGDGQFTYVVKDKNKIEQEVDFLRSCRVPFNWLTHKRGEGYELGTFKVNRKVPVLFRISIDYENATIILHVHNHEALTSQQKTYHPNQINKEFLESLAAFILRQNRAFILLDISDEEKSFIKQQAREFIKVNDNIKNLIDNNE